MKGKDSRYTTILSQNSPFDIREAYGILRANLQFESLANNLKSVLITSAQPMDGKSTVAINLAVTMAASGKKVLLIDADLRRPCTHKYLKVKSVPGLTNWLVNDVELEHMITETKHGFDLLPSGPIPPNPSELLSIEKMDRLMKQAEEEYDFVIVDSPPAGLMADAAILSRYVSGVLMVVRYKGTKIDNVIHAKESLERANAKIIGCVLANVKADGYKRSQMSQFGYSYNYSYRNQ